MWRKVVEEDERYEEVEEAHVPSNPTTGNEWMSNDDTDDDDDELLVINRTCRTLLKVGITTRIHMNYPLLLPLSKRAPHKHTGCSPLPPLKD